MEARMKRMEAQLSRWRSKIDALAARAEEADPRAGLEIHQRIDDLKAKFALTQSKLEKLKSARP